MRTPIVQLTKVTSPTTLAVSVPEAKRHLNIEVTESYYDSDIESYLYVAQEWVEEFTNLTLFTTSFSAVWSQFPEDAHGPLQIPKSPVISIGTLTYRDTDGTLVNLNKVTEVQTSLSSKPAVILPLPDETWPDTQYDRVDAVTVTFDAGYGATSATVPHRIKQAIKLLVGHWFRNREAVVTGTISKEIELAVESLLKQIRVNEFVEFQQQ
jgi:uncharacterized phiE125 gp8 family phage protein